MNRPLKALLIALICLISVISVKADIVFPARLELKQVNDSTFDVLFTLPVIKGRILRATPLLPCLDNYEPKITIDNFAKTMTWRVTCAQLHGQEVGLEGLGGNQVDILLRIEFLNGRVVQTTLSPVQPTYIVPPPPTSFYIIKTGFTSGIRAFLSRIILLFLILILFPSTSVRNWLIMAGCYLGGTMIAILLHENNYLVFQDNFLFTILLAVTLITIIRRASGQIPVFNKQWYAAALLVGLACGAGISPSVLLSGLTTAEYGTWIAGIILGIAAGIAVILAAGYHLRRAREIRRTHKKSVMKWLWVSMGAVVTAMLVYDASLYLVLPPPPLLLSVALFFLVGPALVRMNTWGIPLIMGAAFIGGVAGSNAEYPAILSVLPAFAILWFLITRSASFRRSLWSDVLVAIAGAMASGWITAQNIINTMSYPTANLVGLFILVSMVLILLYMQSLKVPSSALIRGISAVGIFFILLIYFTEVYEELAYGLTEFSSLGKLPIPIISLILLVGFLLLLPRKRKIHRQMKVKGPAIGPALTVLGLAILTIPYGWTSLNNPWSSGNLMSDSEAKGILNNALSNVYTAFNLEDEDELFERLSQNVDEDLIDQIYLDSRRRLNAGVREGAQVTVKDIDIIEIVPKDDNGEDQVFEVTWVVTARVKHLQHVHHRRNKYIGDITLRSGEDSWKIAHINLTSEDRTVVPVSSL